MVSPIWRERYVLFCMTTQQIGTGFMLGFPAVLTPALTGAIANASDIHATNEEASWIAAGYALTGPIGFIIMPYLMQQYGRRFINIFWNCFPLAGSCLIALAPNVTALFIGRCIQGISFCGMFLTNLMAAEYSHPKRRGVFIVIKVALIYVGVVICHSLVYVFNWRNVSWLSAAPPLFGILTTVTWSESPSWLAYKGRFDECRVAFELLRGSDNEARAEIKELIAAQQELRRMKSDTNVAMRVISALRSKEFLKPFASSTVLFILTHSSGLHYLTAYVIEIMIKLCKDNSKAVYYTIGFDISKLVAVIMSVVIVRIFKRRTLIIFGGGISGLLMGSLCIFHYMNEAGIFDFTWLTPLILILYNFLCNLAVIPISVVYMGELYPQQYKGIGTSIGGVLNSMSAMVLVKITSNMLESLNIHGTLAIYLTIMAVTLVFLYYFLIETKDRTLQDIENECLNLNLQKEKDDYSEMENIL